MKPHPAHPLPPALESAVQRLKLAARDAAQRTVESLGLAALSALHAQQREQLLSAQFELQCRLSAFALTFDHALDERLIRELGQRVGLNQPAGSDGDADSKWDSMRLVDDGEVEAQISADRFAMDIAHGCEWELREIDAYLGSVLPDAAAWLHSGYSVAAANSGYSSASLQGAEPGTGPLRNPLRPELVGHALVKGINLLTERAELRKLLLSEMGRSLAGLLRTSYAAIVADWRQSGLRPASLAVRRRLQRDAVEAGLDGVAERDSDRSLERGNERGHEQVPDRSQGRTTDLRTSDRRTSDRRSSDRSNSADGGDSAYMVASARARTSDQAPLGEQNDHSLADASRGAPNHSRLGPRGRGVGGHNDLGTVDPGLMSLIRRLAYSAVPVAAGVAGGPTGLHDPANPRATLAGGLQGSLAGYATGGEPSEVPGNLIHAHRDELRQAANGALDHMVIDVIGFLFDQILSDPKVPPQMARLLARLQLPVLRAALGDAAFFASRRHPVRRFVNRMATLSAAFDDIQSAEAQAFLAKAGALVHEVVEGDFEQIALYEDKLAALEAFVAQQQAELLDSAGQNAATLMAQKEDELRLQQLYAERLAGDLRSVSAPLFVLDFLSHVWSQVLLTAQAHDARTTPPGQLAAKLHPVARDLVLSVQPKATPAQRKELLSELPRLMRSLTEGMELVGWPQDQRREFFGQLMPAHAEALKATAGRQLDINLTMRQVDGAWSRPPPSRTDLSPGNGVPVLRDVLLPVKFSDEEAARIGLVEETAVQWNGQLDIDVDDLAAQAEQAAEAAEDAQAQLAPVALPGMPEWAVDADPLIGRELADQVQIGFAYQMHVEGEWHKVRLSHVSAGRSFYIFTRGSRHQKTMSLTHRMLVRLCEAERFRAIETRTLLERATVRARQQLAELAAASRSSPRAGLGRLH